MFIDNLKDIVKAPDSGYVLAYTRKEVLLKSYDTVEDVVNMLSDVEVLELHMFDHDLEYRAITTESARYPEGVIEHVAEFDMPGSSGQPASELPKDVYREDCRLDQDQDGVLSILSHIAYTETGMTLIDDYRLVMGGEKNE